MRRIEISRQCDIIIPVWNLPGYTKECIESLKKHTVSPYHLIVVDNGCEAETRKYIDAVQAETLGMILIRNTENLGFVKAVNQGIAISGSRYVCILNNDTILTDGWLEELISIMEERPEIGILNPSSNTSGQFPGDMQLDDYARTLSGQKGMIQELYNARGFCMVVRKDLIEKLGPLDEIYHMGYFDDTDYCKRAQQLGYRTARAKASYVYHKENRSFALHKDNNELFKKNEEIFFSRWGRHLRVGYFIRRIDTDMLRKKIDDVAIDVARSGHQISLFMKKGLAWPVTLDHFDIRKFDVGGAFYALIALYKIMKRRKKKALHVLITEDRRLGRFLTKTTFLHKTDVLVQPQKERLLHLLQKKSKMRG